jgi:poly(A) polymerase
VVKPVIISRDQHSVSRDNISDHALKVLYRLKKGGYDAFLVGGGVRDLLLNKAPKDFDIATNATPEQIKSLFRNCRIIGRRFRLAHVFFGRDIIEVATFRCAQDGAENSQHKTDDGMLMRDNCYGSIEEDAWRRDFSINALYYNIADFSIVDFTGGMDDIDGKLLRLLGDTEKRYREDPVRMIRAIRFSAKLGFELEASVADGIHQYRSLLEAVPPARMFEECLKLFMSGHAQQVFSLLKEFKLLPILFPPVASVFDQPEGSSDLQLMMNSMRNTDVRINDSKPVTPAFLFAVMLWSPIRILSEQNRENGDSPAVAMQRASSAVLSEQIQAITIPKRFSMMSRDMWHLQHRFEKRNGKAPARFMEHPRFRAAYDFMLLRSEVGEVSEEIAQWWTERQLQDNTHQAVKEPVKRRHFRRRKPRKKPVD